VHTTPDQIVEVSFAATDGGRQEVVVSRRPAAAHRHGGDF
jgi:hypothetical protein